MNLLHFDHHGVIAPVVYPPSFYAALPPHTDPAAPHLLGQKNQRFLAKERDEPYRLLNISKEATLHVTSSGAEGVSQILYSVYNTLARQEGKNQFLAGVCEEAAIFKGLQFFQTLSACASFLPIDENGQLLPKTVLEAITPKTALLSCSVSNALTGVVQPLYEIAAICRKRGILLHLELSNGFSWLDLDLDALRPDYMTLDGRSIGSCMGLVYARPGAPLLPLIFGGEVRGGPIDAEAEAKFIFALSQALQNRDEEAMQTALLRRQFEEAVTQQWSEARVLFKGVERLPHVSCIMFPGIEADMMLYALNEAKVLASFGGGQRQQLRYLLQASRIPPQEAACALSFAFSSLSKQEEIVDGALRIVTTAKQLRGLTSSLWKAQV